MGWRILCWILDSPLMTKINWVFPKCFHWICWQNICHRAISCARDQDATTAPARHVWETGSLNWGQFMLQWFFRFLEFRWIQWIPVSFRENSIVGLKCFWNLRHSLSLKFRTTAVVPNNSSAVSFTAFCLTARVCKWEYPPYLWNPEHPQKSKSGTTEAKKTFLASSCGRVVQTWRRADGSSCLFFLSLPSLKKYLKIEK